MLFINIYDVFKRTVQKVPAVVQYKNKTGGVAQLGERRVRNAKVAGSNPVVSIFYKLAIYLGNPCI